MQKLPPLWSWHDNLFHTRQPNLAEPQPLTPPYQNYPILSHTHWPNLTEPQQPACFVNYQTTLSVPWPTTSHIPHDPASHDLTFPDPDKTLTYSRYNTLYNASQIYRWTGAKGESRVIKRSTGGDGQVKGERYLIKRSIRRDEQRKEGNYKVKR